MLFTKTDQTVHLKTFMLNMHWISNAEIQLKFQVTYLN